MVGLSLIDILSLAGVFAFAISGGLQAVRQRMDIFGVVMVAFLPAIGGGTMRDILLDTPVFWLNDPLTLIMAALAGLATFVAPSLFAQWKSLRWFDAAGMALFAVLGSAKAYELGHGPLTVVIMGTMTATAGGLLRDIVCDVRPLLLRQDIYATAAMAGAAAYTGLRAVDTGQTAALLVGAALAFGIRAAALRWAWSLPVAGAGGSES